LQYTKEGSLALLPDPQSKIIAAIPAYNEARHIEEIVSKTLRYVGQVIVVDDGSEDGTGERARGAGADVVTHRHNRGYGGALKSCLEKGREQDADVLVLLDADGQHIPNEVPKVAWPVLEGRADIVIGSRFLNNHNNVPRYRKFGIDVITWLFNAGSSVKVSDAQSGFRAYSKRALDMLLPLEEEGMSISMEIIIKARKLGLRMCEVPITCLYIEGSSTLNPVVHGVSVAMLTLVQRVRYMGVNGDNSGVKDVSLGEFQSQDI
jgi:glycosyltransferase involved in cell wall biosynthesis